MTVFQHPSAIDRACVPGARGRASAREGFSLIEVVIAMAILTVVFLGFFQWVDHSQYMAHNIRLRGEANAVLVSEAELLRTLIWDEVVALEATGPLTLLDPNGPFSGTREVVTLSDELRSTRLTINWTDPKGETRTVYLVTVLTREGISAQ